ncbi:energy-coupling factor transporter ATPase [Acholeplasma sp. OttesenSCG-928-E16]|nr:energy-coupling factor transporter ATPase [Acholeplasma sp. OttesenSCG-928-E16]
MDIKFEKVSHLYKDYRKGVDAIKDIDLVINAEDEFIAICGKTGSGKSTLVQHLNALLLPTSGNLFVLGQKLPPNKREKVNHLRQKIGLVFQFPEYQLFENTVIKDIMFGPNNFKATKVNAKELAEKSAALVGITSDLYERSPFQISGGQMRRVAIAGILAMNPKVLVLDEPTRGLDPKGRDEMMAIFKKINEEEKKTIIMITHDMDLVSKYAKRVIVLKDGKIAFDGQKEDLFELKDFDSFSLDLPRPLKILKELSAKLNFPYIPKYSIEEVYEYLTEVFNVR